MTDPLPPASVPATPGGTKGLPVAVILVAVCAVLGVGGGCVVGGIMLFARGTVKAVEADKVAAKPAEGDKVAAKLGKKTGTKKTGSKPGAAPARPGAAPAKPGTAPAKPGTAAPAPAADDEDTSMAIWEGGSKRGEIEADGKIWRNGSHVGDIEANGKVWLGGGQVGSIESDGKIWRQGSHLGSIEADGKIWIRNSHVAELDPEGKIWVNNAVWGETTGASDSFADRRAIVAYLVFCSGAF